MRGDVGAVLLRVAADMLVSCFRAGASCCVGGVSRSARVAAAMAAAAREGWKGGKDGKHEHQDLFHNYSSIGKSVPGRH